MHIARQRHNWARIIDAWPSLGLQTTFAVLVLIPLVGLVLARLLRLARHDRPLDAHRIATWTACWCGVPPLIAWLTTLTGIAALWMLRYLVASVVGAIVFAGMCCASHRSRWYRGLLATAVVCASIASSGMVQQWRLDGRWIGDRSEAWNEAVPWVSQQHKTTPAPVFVCAGLLEDRALQNNPDATLREYCLFPVRGLYRLAVVQVEPLPTTSTLLLDDQQWRAVKHRGGAWVIIRARPHTADLILRALTSQTGTSVAERRHFGTLTVARLAVS